MQSHVSAFILLDMRFHHQINWDLQDKNQPLTSSKSSDDCEQFQHQIRLKVLFFFLSLLAILSGQRTQRKAPWHRTFSVTR